ncbi:hypothetical protein PGTUg99_030468 [Puccinia graminis f. sp. tritici]|uniref:Uncharacterized protein n=1 Tax=Puccinia graminis f. sp. tritici TaxID=56615 RepID=A0A5B0NKG7_PUCGR|nr:hypothetical protein PGTUg99_030468 [Puccinia graminis f. sp. tritici]
MADFSPASGNMVGADRYFVSSTQERPFKFVNETSSEGHRDFLLIMPSRIFSVNFHHPHPSQSDSAFVLPIRRKPVVRSETGVNLPAIIKEASLWKTGGFGGKENIDKLHKMQKTSV